MLVFLKKNKDMKDRKRQDMQNKDYLLLQELTETILGLTRISHNYSGNLDNLSRHLRPQTPSPCRFDNVLRYLRTNLTQHIAQFPSSICEKSGLRVKDKKKLILPPSSFIPPTYSSSFAAQHFLYFLPLPQGHGSFLPTLGRTVMG